MPSKIQNPQPDKRTRNHQPNATIKNLLATIKKLSKIEFLLQRKWGKSV